MRSIGRATWGAVIGDGLLDLGPNGTVRPCVRRSRRARCLHIAKEVAGAQADRAKSSVTFLPTIPDADKIICIGRNYKAHVAESGGKPLEFPSVFIRLAASQVGHGQPIRLSSFRRTTTTKASSRSSSARRGRHIARERTLSHIAGYVVLQRGVLSRLPVQAFAGHRQELRASGAFGPWMTTADEIPDPRELELTTRLNGVQVQHASVSELIFDIPHLIAYLSGMTELVPGDVIVTGTPEGVGFARTPPLWMKAGDEVEVEISRIGCCATASFPNKLPGPHSTTLWSEMDTYAEQQLSLATITIRPRRRRSWRPR